MDYSLEHLLKFQNNPCIIWKDSISNTKVYYYNDVIQTARDLIDSLRELRVKKHCKVLVNIEHSTALLPVLLSILNMECCYCPVNISDQEIEKTLHLHKAQCLITDRAISAPFKSQQAINSLNMIVHIYTFNLETSCTSLENDVLCYAIQTSGSTGEPKIINVPYSCILPNIISLSDIFKVTSDDVIFMSSPPTFDPSIVDIFLALRNGAALLLVPLAMRLLSETLAKLIFRDDSHNTTVCQMTPSLFRRFRSHVLSECVFHKDTSLRTLILGGEPFPSPDEFKNWPVWSISKNIRIFNIYGITEVSCWISIEEIFKDTTEPSLGHCLDEDAALVVRNTSPPHDIVSTGHGKLFIDCRKRRCFLNSESSSLLEDHRNTLSRNTGDLVEIRNGRIYYKSRTIAMIKRFGCRINLTIVEEKIKNALTSISDICCLIDPEKSILIAFIILPDDYPKPTINRLYKHLNKVERPDAVIFTKKFPLSSHGKISKKKLLNHYQSIQKNEFDINREKVKELFTRKLNEYLGLEMNEPNWSHLKRPRAQSWLEISFNDAGGTSFMALRLLSEFEEIFCQNLGNFFIKLLNDSCPLQDVLQELEETVYKNGTILQNESEAENSNKLNLTIAWKYDLKKCVDASPTIATLKDRVLVTVGSHSHQLVALSIPNGLEICKVTLPDRIEGKVTANECIGIVGSYDGFLYKFDLITGEILQSFDSKGMIKCQPLRVGNNLIFGNYSNDNNVFCLEYESFHECWSTRIGTKSCLASPIQYDENSVVICTLDGLIVLIQHSTGHIVWKHKLNSPIFSTPLKLLTNQLIVAEVEGSVHCLQGENKISTYVTNAPVFSSLVALDDNVVVFGCYDYCIYCLQYLDDARTLDLLWRLKLDAQIYSTPSILRYGNITHIIACTTKGKVYIVNYLEGQSVGHIKLEGEVFSSPALYGNRVYVGCRDNYLYCINVHQA